MTARDAADLRAGTGPVPTSLRRPAPTTTKGGTSRRGSIGCRGRYGPANQIGQQRVSDLVTGVAAAVLVVVGR